MNPSEKNEDQPNPSETEPEIEDLSIEDAPDAQDETVKGGRIWIKDALVSS